MAVKTDSTLFQYRAPAKRHEQTSKRKKFLAHRAKKRQKKEQEGGERKKYSQRKLQRDKPSNAYTLKPVLHTRRCTRIIIHVYTREKSPRSFVERGIHLALRSPTLSEAIGNWFHRVPGLRLFYFSTGKPCGHFNRRCNDGGAGPKASLEANQNRRNTIDE